MYLLYNDIFDRVMEIETTTSSTWINWMSIRLPTIEIDQFCFGWQKWPDLFTLDLMGACDKSIDLAISSKLSEIMLSNNVFAWIFLFSILNHFFFFLFLIQFNRKFAPADSTYLQICHFNHISISVAFSYLLLIDEFCFEFIRKTYSLNLCIEILNCFRYIVRPDLKALLSKVNHSRR